MRVITGNISSTVDDKITLGKTRKEKRKENRKIKKLKNVAYAKKISFENYSSSLRITEEKRINKSKKKKKKKSKSNKSKTKDETQANTHEEMEAERKVRIQGLLLANKEEDKILKQLAKQLHLKKKNGLQKLSTGFFNDGLDYILDATDPKKIQEMYEKGEVDADPMTAFLQKQINQNEDQPDEENGDESLDDYSFDENFDENVSDGVVAEDGVVSDDDRSAMEEDLSVTDASFNDMDDDDLRNDEASFSGTESNNSLDDDDDEAHMSDQDTDVSSSSKNSGSSSKWEKKEKKKDISTDLINVNKTSSSLLRKKSDILLQDLSPNDYIDGKKLSKVGSKKEVRFEDTDTIHEESVTSASQKKREKETDASKGKEDIYGRTQESANVKDLYTPPALKAKMLLDEITKENPEYEAKKSEAILTLSKQIRGQINRLSASNLVGISDFMQRLFRSNPRHLVNETLTKLVLEACVREGVRASETLIIDYVALIALLHLKIDAEVGASLIQSLIKTYDDTREISSSENLFVGDRTLHNLLLVAAHLVNFKVIDSSLIFDILNELLEVFGSRQVELMLTVLKGCGFELRKVNPEALKKYIQAVNGKWQQVDMSTFEDPSRVNYMLETLSAIKNNNIRKLADYNPEHMLQCLKLVKIHSQGSSQQQLNISLDDLRRSDELGRWWVVGGVWRGRDMEERGETMSCLDEQGNQMDKLARKVRMNTDIRRAIFSTIMSSEDYMDAYQKLIGLPLKSSIAPREIVVVLFECSLREKSYNPFYSYVLQTMAREDRKYMMACQFAVWDRLKDMQRLKLHSRNNLTSVLTHLISARALPITVFKRTDFTELGQAMFQVVQNVLHHVLSNVSGSSLHHIFKPLISSEKPEHIILSQALLLFMEQFIIRRNSQDVERSVLEKVKCRAEEICQLLTQSRKDSLL